MCEITLNSNLETIQKSGIKKNIPIAKLFARIMTICWLYLYDDLRLTSFKNRCFAFTIHSCYFFFLLLLFTMYRNLAHKSSLQKTHMPKQILSATLRLNQSFRNSWQIFRFLYHRGHNHHSFVLVYTYWVKTDLYLLLLLALTHWIHKHERCIRIVIMIKKKKN